MKKFSEWMTMNFLEWQTKQGKRKTLEEFAAYVGVSRPLVNMWMNGTQRPGANNIKLLADLFGMEAYDVLDLPRPDADFSYLEKYWVDLHPNVRKLLRETAEKYITKKGK